MTTVTNQDFEERASKTVVEVWHVDTNELVGKLELGSPIPEDQGARVVVRVKGTIDHPVLGACNAIEMLVCRMRYKLSKDKYYALETNLPMDMLHRLEGFTPHVRTPSLAEIFAVNSRRLH